MPTYVDLSYMYPLYPIVGAFACIICAIPISAHWRAGNLATILLGLWILGLNIIDWIGTTVWHNNIRNPYPIWGDIVNFYYAMYPTALASCVLCIQYRLWSIARARTVFITKRDKQRQKYSTWAVCLGLPFFVGCLHYVVQGHRYNIIEDLGPMIETYNVTLAFPLFFIWDPTLCVITSVYSILNIRLFLAHRKELDAVLASGSSNVNKDKYMRVLCFAAVSVVIHLPLSLWVILANSTACTVYPWISWEDTHSNYGRIAYTTRFTLQTTPDMGLSLSVTVWVVILSAVIYFVLFGFGEEAMRHYNRSIGAIIKPFGIKYPPKKKRSVIKRTWLDVLLGRPGKPTDLTSSAPTSSMPQFNSKPSMSCPSGNPNTTRSQTTTGGGNDLHLDIANLDFLDPTEARKQARISAYTCPGQATRSPVSPNGRAVLRSFSSEHNCNSRVNEESSEVTDEKGSFDRSQKAAELADEPDQPSTSKEVADVDVDLEAQETEAWQSGAQQARRRAILEANPELTEEMTF